MFMNTSHSFQFYLNSVGFHILDMDSMRVTNSMEWLTESCLLILGRDAA